MSHDYPISDGSNEWQGWAEIESDPAFFNVMLKDMGVKGASVREIFSLDQDMLTFLPRPVYGVIFLFKWKEDEERVDTRFKAGSRVWFANQTVSNACATYALLNIINNIPGLQLGLQLDHFRDFTKDFTPALRGDALANFDFAKRVHNSFTRKMERLSGDLYLKAQAHAAARNSKKRKLDEHDDTPANHFVAFMPIDGVIWKMDGLEWQPQGLGKLKCKDWLDQIKPDLESRMSRYEGDQIEFAILGIVRDPLTDSIEQLAKNIKALQELRWHQNRHDTGSGPFHVLDGTLLGPDSAFGVHAEDIEAASSPATLQKALSEDAHRSLLSMTEELCQRQKELRLAICQEQDAHRASESRVSRRRHDCGNAVLYWLRCLGEQKNVRRVLSAD